MRLHLIIVLGILAASCARRHVPTRDCRIECESAETLCKQQAESGFGSWNCPKRHESCLKACPSEK